MVQFLADISFGQLSGVFQALLGSPFSFGGDILTSGSIIPYNHELYSLGETNRAWANIQSHSGIFTYAALGAFIFDNTTASCDFSTFNFANNSTLNILNTCTLNIGGELDIESTGIFGAQAGSQSTFNGTLSLAGNTEISSDYFGPNTSGNHFLGMVNGAPRPFRSVFTDRATLNVLAPASGSSAITCSGNLMPQNTNTFSLGGAERRWNNIYSANAVFSNLTVNTSSTFTNHRPTVGDSGIALANENLWKASLQQFNNSTLSSLTLAMDGLNSTPFGIPVAGNCKVDAFYGVMTRHSNGSAPNPWVILLRRRNNSTNEDVASGLFTFNAAAGTVQYYTGKWSPQGVTFSDTDGFEVLVHDNASGSINFPVVRATLGFRVNETAFQPDGD